MPKAVDPNILVGLESADDAAVYKISEDVAIVQSVDFFTPVVDDPYTFGRIAVANALSDIYAMGAKPVFGLNLLAFPSKKLSPFVLGEIMKGGLAMAEEAGISIAGGHSIDDEEPKYGLAVTGTVHPDRIMKNSSAKEGDSLVLTKPLGIGIITTAIKKGLADTSVIEEAVRWMTKLNGAASEVMVASGASAATDITGFGLLGHLHEMLLASGVAADIDLAAIPVIGGTEELLEMGAYPGGSRDNMDFVSPFVDWSPKVTDNFRKILCDAQTSGGLLISIPQSKKSILNDSFAGKDIFYSEIGRVVSGSPGRIRVLAS